MPPGMDDPRELDLNDVALFVRVVQTHSFTAAAKERGVPGSTVSRHIARLEASLGVRLLERTTRKLLLTEAGRDYFAHAERAVDDVRQGTDRLLQLRKEPRGKVRILAPVVLGSSVSDALFAFLARHPAVSVDLQLDDRGAALLDDGFDLAIVTGKVERGDVVARPIWRSSRKLLFASPRYCKARGTPKRLEELARHDCIATKTADGLATWALLVNRRKRRLTFAPRFAVSEAQAAKRAALAGVGIALLPEVLCAGDAAAKRLVQVLPSVEGEAGGVSLLYRAHRSLTAAVRACLEHFLAELPASDPSRPRR